MLIFIKKYASVGIALFLVVATWQIQEWRHDAIQKDAVIDAMNNYETRIKTANDRAAQLEVKLAKAKKKKTTQTKKVNDYVESKAADPVCFDDVAIRLFNANRNQ